MADKIAKLLKKLSVKQLQLLLPIIEQIVAGELEGLDVKALKGQKNIYRARQGNFRIIFTVSHGETRIISIAKRDEKTYKNF